MGLAPYGEPVYVDRICRPPDRPAARRLVPHGHEVLRLPLRPDHDEPALRRPVRRSAPCARVGDHAAGDGPRGVDPGRHRGDRAHAWRVRPPSRRASATRAWPAASRSTACANGRLLREGPFENIWIQPAAGDAGGAVGAALYGWHQILDEPREVDGVHDGMQGAYLGPRFGERRDRDLARRAGLSRTSDSRERPAPSGSPADRRRRRRRPVPGSHGVRAPALGPPVDHRRPALVRRCSRS